MVFDGTESCPLPPLYSFTMYFTHADVTLEHIDAAELLAAIKRDNGPLDTTPLRIELHSLPVQDVAESDEACIAHYQIKKRSRGTYTRQIEAFETSIKTGVDSRTGNLPGLVPSYVSERMIEYHHGILYNYTGPDWRAEKKPARCVHFDHISQDEFEDLQVEFGELEALPSVYVSLQAFQESDAEHAGVASMGMKMFEMAHGSIKNETLRPWQEAVELEWSNW